MTTASQIARYIVAHSQEVGDPVTNLKLQKLLYYVQGWNLGVNEAPAFPERLEAWVHGPVQPAVYGQYKHYRWNPIADEVAKPELPCDVEEIVKEVLEVYGADSGWELERRTHLEPPWLEARGDLPKDQESNRVISQDSMKRYFRSLADGQ